MLSTNPVPTRYSDTVGESDSVINLMFLYSGLSKLNNYSIHPEWQLTSDHISLMVTIPIADEFVQSSKFSLPKKSEEKEAFVKEAISIIKSLDTSNLTNQESLEEVVNLFASKIKQAWNANARKVNITKHSKKWWNEDCNWSLKKSWRLEIVQKDGQDYQIIVFWYQDPDDHQQEPRTLGTHELD